MGFDVCFLTRARPSWCPTCWSQACSWPDWGDPSARWRSQSSAMKESTATWTPASSPTGEICWAHVHFRGMCVCVCGHACGCFCWVYGARFLFASSVSAVRELYACLPSHSQFVFIPMRFCVSLPQWGDRLLQREHARKTDHLLHLQETGALKPLPVTVWSCEQSFSK